MPRFKFRMFGTIDTDKWEEIEHDEMCWLLEGLVTAPTESAAYDLLNEYQAEGLAPRTHLDGIDIEELADAE